MKILDGHIVFELTKCGRCHGEGSVARPLPCPTCHGTGNGTRGGRGGCKKCYGSGRTYKQDVRDVCPTCHGIDSQACEPEDICDAISDDDWRSFEFRVYRSGRPQTWGEAYLGAGVFSCTDYGDHKNMSDEVLVKSVRESTHYVQAVKIANRDTLKVADHIGIFTNNNGYSVLPVWE